MFVALTSTNDGEQHVPPAEIGHPVLEERKDAAACCRAAASASASQISDERRRRSPTTTCDSELVAREQAVMAVPRDLEVVVDEADRAEGRRRQHRDPDVRDSVRSAQSSVGTKHRRQNQQPAHRRRAGLRLVARRTVLADDLADLKLAQPADEPGPEQQAERQRRQARRRRAERDVAGRRRRTETSSRSG